MTKPVLRYPGSKWGMAKAILQHFPPHNTYVEPFFGGGSIFFSKEPSKYEVVNDKAGEVVRLFRCIRDHGDELGEAVRNTPWARLEYENSYEPPTGNDIEDCRKFLVRCWQAYGIRLSVHTGWRNRGSSRGSPPARDWNDLPERIAIVAKRLRGDGVEIDNRDAVEVIMRYADQDDTLYYCDPPYVLSTRTGDYYLMEMSDEDHYCLLNALLGVNGAVILSGYNHPLYEIMLRDWHHVEIRDIAEQGQERTEFLWMNKKAFYARQRSWLDALREETLA